MLPSRSYGFPSGPFPSSTADQGAQLVMKNVSWCTATAICIPPWGKSHNTCLMRDKQTSGYLCPKALLQYPPSYNGQPALRVSGTWYICVGNTQSISFLTRSISDHSKVCILIFWLNNSQVSCLLQKESPEVVSLEPSSSSFLWLPLMLLVLLHPKL